MKEKLFAIIEQSREKNNWSYAYDVFMLITIAASIIPLMFAYDCDLFIKIEHITVVIFIIDYLLRWFTADCKLGKGAWSYLLYPFTAWAIIDLLSILPGLSVLGRGFTIFRVTRLLKIMRLFSWTVNCLR